MKKEIFNNLLQLFNESKLYLKNVKFADIIDNHIYESDTFYKDMGMNNYLEDKEAINYAEYKTNKTLNKLFEKAVLMNIDKKQIKTKLEADLKLAFSEISLNFKSNKQTTKNQIIFFEHNDLPIASIIGYGKGEYSIVKSPEYLDSYPTDEVYVAIEKIDFSLIWNDLLNFTTEIEDLELDNCVLSSEIYTNLSEMYIYQTYLLLHETLEEVGEELFTGIDIEKPLMIYGNEHDCGAISVFVYE